MCCHPHEHIFGGCEGGRAGGDARACRRERKPPRAPPPPPRCTECVPQLSSLASAPPPPGWLIPTPCRVRQTRWVGRASGDHVARRVVRRCGCAGSLLLLVTPSRRGSSRGAGARPASRGEQQRRRRAERRCQLGHAAPCRAACQLLDALPPPRWPAPGPRGGPHHQVWSPCSAHSAALRSAQQPRPSPPPCARRSYNTTEFVGSGMWVEVALAGVHDPSADDLLAVFSPPDAHLEDPPRAPVKYELAAAAGAAYLSSGEWRLALRLVNLREDFRVVLVRHGDFDRMKVVAEGPVITNANKNEMTGGGTLACASPPVQCCKLNGWQPGAHLPPPGIHLMLGHRPWEMVVQWTSRSSVQPTVRYGSAPGQLQYVVPATTVSYTRDDLCGAPANAEGFVDPGSLHTAVMTGLEPGSRVFYTVGDQVGAWGSHFRAQRSKLTPQDCALGSTRVLAPPPRPPPTRPPITSRPCTLSFRTRGLGRTSLWTFWRSPTRAWVSMVGGGAGAHPSPATSLDAPLRARPDALPPPPPPPGEPDATTAAMEYQPALDVASAMIDDAQAREASGLPYTLVLHPGDISCELGGARVRWCRWRKPSAAQQACCMPPASSSHSRAIVAPFGRRAGLWRALGHVAVPAEPAARAHAHHGCRRQPRARLAGPSVLQVQCRLG